MPEVQGHQQAGPLGKLTLLLAALLLLQPAGLRLAGLLPLLILLFLILCQLLSVVGPGPGCRPPRPPPAAAAPLLIAALATHILILAALLQLLRLPSCSRAARPLQEGVALLLCLLVLCLLAVAVALHQRLSLCGRPLCPADRSNR